VLDQGSGLKMLFLPRCLSPSSSPSVFAPTSAAKTAGAAHYLRLHCPFAAKDATLFMDEGN
jgi:hypothetical protein